MTDSRSGSYGSGWRCDNNPFKTLLPSPFNAWEKQRYVFNQDIGGFNAKSNSSSEDQILTGSQVHENVLWARVEVKDPGRTARETDKGCSTKSSKNVSKWVLITRGSSPCTLVGLHISGPI